MVDVTEHIKTSGSGADGRAAAAPFSARAQSRDEVLSIVRGEAAAIRRLGATALYLFGSAARDELGPESDVDVFIDFDPEGPFSFVELIDLQEVLKEKLQRDVDLTTRGGLHPRLKARIERSSIKVL